MISKELRSIFTQAVGYAKSSKHEYLTLEHVFLMLIHDQTIENLFLDLGVDTNKLFNDIKKYIASLVTVLKNQNIGEDIFSSYSKNIENQV